MTTDFGCGDQSRELEGNRKGSLSARHTHWSGSTVCEHGSGCRLATAMSFRSRVSVQVYCLVNIPAATRSTAKPALTLSAVVLPTVA